MNRAERRRAEKEIRKGNASKAVQDVYKDAWEKGSAATVEAMMFLTCDALRKAFGFGETRLTRFAQAVDSQTTDGSSLTALEKEFEKRYPTLTEYIKGNYKYGEGSQ